MNEHTHANMEMKNRDEGENLVFTLGTGALTSDQFDGILRDHEVSILVDVRSKPAGWNRGLWKSALEKRYGDNYRWLGDKIGGFDIDENYGSTKWSKGIHQIIELSRTGRLAIFCAENNPDECHRKIISKELESQGFQVIHIQGSHERALKQE